MAIALLQQPFAFYSGKTGQTGAPVAYKRGNRTVTRRLVTPANPKSTLQTSVRAAFSQSSKAFSNISDANKATWEALNAQILRKDTFGTDYRPTAKGLYTGVNDMRILDSQAVLDIAPPAIIQLAATDVTTFELEIGGATINLIFAHANADGHFFIELTQALPGTARQPRDTDFAAIVNAYVNAIALRGASPQTFVATVADMKVPVVAGDRYGIRITSFSPGYLKGQSFTKVMTATQAV